MLNLQSFQQIALKFVPLKFVTSSLQISFIRLSIAALSTLALTWILFQKKLLPHGISKIVSKVFFYPTFPITILSRYNNYMTKLDDTLILGCAPIGILGHPEKMYKMGVRGVINMCYEYPGPKSSYARLGIKQLHLPTVDHFEPSLDYMKEAVAFIQEYKDRGEKVYVHCKAANGRGAGIALCWLIHTNKQATAQELNKFILSKRKVRKELYNQANIKAFAKHAQL